MINPLAMVIYHADNSKVLNKNPKINIFFQLIQCIRLIN